jgi:hypothetical protein
MCEYCGCQDVTAIGDLTREHDEVTGLMAHVRAAHTAEDVAAMAELARRISEILRPHTAVEEEGLFPLLAPDFPDQVAVLCAEHRQRSCSRPSSTWSTKPHTAAPRCSCPATS